MGEVKFMLFFLQSEGMVAERLKMRSYKRSILLFTLLTVFILVLAGTSKSADTCSVTTPCGTTTEVKLLAGQYIDVGTVTVKNDASCLCITYATTGDWYLTEVHFHIAKNWQDIPQKNGNPIPGKFAYKMTFDPPVTSYERCFDLSNLLGGLKPGDTIYIAAHAVVVKKDDSGNIIQKETAWGEGPEFPGKNWAMYFTYEIQSCGEPSPEPTTCETAFAYGGTYATCFLDINLSGFKPDRWGWTNGPLGAGNYTFDIYAGAGQCDLTKGTKVGTLTVNYDGSSSVYIKYYMFPGYSLNETHVYVGSDILPKDKKGKWTVAPGQYPYSGSEVTVNISGPIYIIAHAVVCKQSNTSSAPPMQKDPQMVTSLWGKIKSEY